MEKDVVTLTKARRSSPPPGRVKRYNLALPGELFGELQAVADERNTSVVDLIRRFVKLGLIAVQIESTPGAALLIREGDSERQILLL